LSNEEFKNLREGDVVRGKFSAQIFIITANYGRRVTAVWTVDITNPDEFDIIHKAAGPGPGPLDLPKPSKPAFE